MGALSIELTIGGWTDGLPAGQRKSISDLLDGGMTEEEVADLWLSKFGSQNTAGFGGVNPITINGADQPTTYFTRVRSEFLLFVCGDLKYEEERQKAVNLWNGSKTTLVTVVAGCIATHVALAAASIVPVVGLMFALTAKLGINALCKECPQGESLPEVGAAQASDET